MKKYTATFQTKTGVVVSHVIDATNIIEAKYFALRHKVKHNLEGSMKVYMIKGANKNKPRKTFEIDSFKERANLLLSDPKLSVEFKEGVVAMTEFVLHKGDTYNGYMYTTPGLNSDNTPKPGTQEHITRKYF